MNPKLKLALYVGLLGCMAVFGYGLYTSYHAKPRKPGQTGLSANTVATTGQGATNGVIDTNGLPESVNTNTAAQTNSAAVQAGNSSDTPPVQKRSAQMGRMMGFGAGMFACLIGLALLLGNDVSRYLANRVDEFVFNDNLEGVTDPEYEEAERVWASGQHLEALQLMRDYLKKHPREQYVALRIAEIYEGDLHNYLAAALEYEEVLKKKLPAERWGWAAVHLANLYSGKLNKSEQATTLLRRIVSDYGQTAAAKKARERLGLPEPVPTVAAPAVEPEPEPVKPEAPANNLPPGFRPK
jgi:TolA-binding protein